MDNRIFCLMGPSASGKTALACELVQRFPFEIISVDSAMIYRGMDIGTAKPDKKTLAAAPHHLIDIVDPQDTYSVARFCDEVAELCSTIRLRQRIPLLVGGTMMYFHALTEGLSVLPSADASLRRELLQTADTRGWDYMHRLLNEVEKDSSKRHAADFASFRSASHFRATFISIFWPKASISLRLRKFCVDAKGSGLVA